MYIYIYVYVYIYIHIFSIYVYICSQKDSQCALPAIVNPIHKGPYGSSYTCTHNVILMPKCSIAIISGLEIIGIVFFLSS